jgi:hypothetical protein
MMIDRKGCLQLLAAITIAAVALYAIGKMVVGWFA